MNTEHVGDLVELAALGALNAEEAAFVRAHVGDCPRCRALLDEAEATAAMLALAVPMRRAPMEMRRRVMTEVIAPVPVAVAPIASLAGPRAPNALMRFNRRWGAMAAMLFAVPLAGLLTWAFVLQSEVNSLKQENRQIQETQQDFVLLALPTSARARFTPTDQAGEARGMVSWNPDLGKCAVRVSGLPRPDGGVSYRVYYETPKGVIDAGELKPDEEGSANLTFDASKWQGNEYRVWVSSLRGQGDPGTVLLAASLRRE